MMRTTKTTTADPTPTTTRGSDRLPGAAVGAVAAADVGVVSRATTRTTTSQATGRPTPRATTIPTTNRTKTPAMTRAARRVPPVGGAVVGAASPAPLTTATKVHRPTIPRTPWCTSARRVGQARQTRTEAT